MKVAVNDIRSAVVESDFIEDWAVYAARGPVEFRSDSPVSGHFRLIFLDDKILIRMDFKVVLEFSCSRCLEPCSQQIEKHIDMLLYPKVLQSKMMDLDIHAADVDFYPEDYLDTSDYVWEEILLSIPMKPLCSEECRGLCHHCGMNLNISSCDCRELEFDPRWNNLLQLKDKLKSP
jgi:uncharacterized protein